MNTTQRRDELLGIMEERYESLPHETKGDIAFHRTDVPMWLQIQRSIQKQITEKNDAKRLLLPMPESDPVVKLLLEMRDKVGKLVSQRHEDVNGEDADFDGGQSESYQTETKQMLIHYLEGFIAERKLDTSAIFGSTHDNENYLASSEFGNLKELYDFLEELSEKSDEEIDNFILNTLPGYPWDIPHMSLKGE